MKYLYPKQIVYLHKHIIDLSGGSHGSRDMGLLESAVYRPQASFGGQNLYPDLFLKVAVLGYSIIANYPFIDGNKRVGFEAMRLMLRLNRYDLKASTKQKYDFVMDIAEKNRKEQEMADWIKKHIKPY